MPRLLCSLVLAGLAACYQPSYEEGVACGPGGACPDGLTCRGDGRCRSGDDPTDSGPGVNPIDATAGGPADSGPPDAAAVGCRGDGECQTPPTLCHLPGTCDLEAGVCVFPDVDCSSLDGECARGSCDLASGSCIAEAINQDTLCGEGESCGPFGACAADGVGDVCDLTGVQTRSCTVNTCQAGACAAASVADMASCTLDTTGVGCGDTTVECGACTFSSTCDETGSQSCTCTSYACSGGTCTANPQSCPETCTRDTDSEPCFNDGTCVNGFCQQNPCPLCVVPGWVRPGPAGR